MRQEVLLGEEQRAAVAAGLEAWDRESGTERLWRGDATLWTDDGEERWLAWLRATEADADFLTAAERLAREVAASGFTDFVVLGMGGSSLCPEVLGRTFGSLPGHPRPHVLDSTAPAQVAEAERRIDPDRTLFVVSSKSGTTLETALLMEHFRGRLERRLGPEEAARRFVAVTDPGSRLEEIAGEGFRALFHGEPEIGGRFSALSPFGLVPAAIQGLDVARLLARGAEMAAACGPGRGAAANPGVHLGVVLGTLGRRGVDKVTLVPSPGIATLGAWLEQLVAESTGKRGVALIPVDGEPPAPVDRYGSDRLFVRLRLGERPEPELDDRVEELRRAGHPVVSIELRDPYDLAAEFFRWEVATAVAGAVLGINPFDQPDVEAAKVATRALMEVYQRTGSLPAERPFLEEGGLALYADERNAGELLAAAGPGADLGAVLDTHLDRLGPGDYFALLAWLAMTEEHHVELQAIRAAVLRRGGAATCLGYGPRFLHSTGQAHKGGPDRGVFLQVTGARGPELPIPGRGYDLATVLASQARGDHQVLAERGRRLLRVDLGEDPAATLPELRRRIAGS
ncbi:MAG: bifunctional transaldolase/phosoglucose isomerase [Thermoanaerobaculia bacterium]|nr:bifunctional transaldolase/phosoglucose isomerase [Thermoanaerobaculia bacterium]